ncbi:hypothetical protein A2U01_0082342, partial [Trifolium medium]|nr:hypothetical protein [Trifolium medium]
SLPLDDLDGSSNQDSRDFANIKSLKPEGPA